MSSPRDLAAIPSPALEGTALTVVVPVGSFEQHGPHLPLDTDTRIARAVAQALPDVVVAPAIEYGASGEHEGFAGTISIGAEAMETVVVEYGRSAFRWTKRVLFVNGHGGNGPALAKAVALLRYEGVMLLGCRALLRVPTRMPDTLKRAYCCTFRPIWCT